jgi:hypothetical protein
MFHIPSVARKLLFVAAASAVAISALVFGQRGEVAHIIFMISAPLAALTAISMLRTQRARHRDGWKHLTVSLSDFFLVAGLVGMTAFFLYVFYFVGSARSDARSQMIGLQVLVAGFATLSALAAWCTLGFNTRWNGQIIEQEGLFIRKRQVRVDNLATLDFEAWSNCYRLQAYDGTRIRILRSHNGAEELIRDLLNRT